MKTITLQISDDAYRVIKASLRVVAMADTPTVSAVALGRIVTAIENGEASYLLQTSEERRREEEAYCNQGIDDPDNWVGNWRDDNGMERLSARVRSAR